MRSKNLIVLILLVAVVNLGYAQSSIDFLRKGNAKYKEKKFESAEVDYRKALEKDKNERRAIYNLGNALYKQEKYNESKQKYLEILNSSKNNIEKANAYYNLGNALLKEKKVQRKFRNVQKCFET